MIYLTSKNYDQYSSETKDCYFCTMNAIMNIANFKKCYYFLLEHCCYFAMLQSIGMGNNYDRYNKLPISQGITEGGSPYIMIGGIMMELMTDERAKKLALLE